MKVTELMVGDYICLDGDINYDIPIRIQQIGYHGENEIVADSDVFGVEDIIPIPLTEEILAKNGFEQKYNLTYVSGQVEIIKHRDNWNVVINKYCVFVDMNIKFVHQLQHLLRLVGIQKEIEL